MIHFDRQIVVGLTLDLSLQHHLDGRRYIDIVKESLIRFATQLGLNSGVYVAHPENHVMPRQQGESVFLIDAYQEPPGFRADEALAQTINMLAAQEADERFAVYITDRYRKNNQIPALLSRNQRCRMIVLGLGEKYDRRLQELKGCDALHLDGPEGVGRKLSDLIIVGV